jgi:hypothetical protein
LRHADAHARALGRRAVLDVEQAFPPAVAMYEAEGWHRVDELHLAVGPEWGVDPDARLHLWVYVSPE